MVVRLIDKKYDLKKKISFIFFNFLDWLTSNYFCLKINKTDFHLRSHRMHPLRQSVLTRQLMEL